MAAEIVSNVSGTPESENGKEKNEEEELLDQRRKLAGIEKPDSTKPEPTWGLALSGGGIRSATFCLGFIRALARNDAFRRFDYLSTVSGGGYVGAAVGRLFNAANTREQVKEVHAGIASDETLFLWWLRSNGRYLTPQGVWDVLLAVASYLRGALATQLDAGMFFLVLALFVMAPHVVFYACGAPTAWRDQLHCLLTLWWCLALIPAFFVLVFSASYFLAFVSGSPGKGSHNGGALNGKIFALARRIVLFGVRIFFGVVRIGFCVVVFLYAYFQFVDPAPAQDATESVSSLPWICILSVMAALLLAEVIQGVGRGAAPQRRVALSKWLTRALAGALILGTCGALDVVSWTIKVKYSQNADHNFLAYAGGIAWGLLLAVRAAMPTFNQGNGLASKFKMPLLKIGNAVGMMTVLLLALIFLSLLQMWVFDNRILPDRVTQTDPQHAFFWRYLFAWVLAIIYLICTYRNLDQLNWSSLHPFYRSRLARAYVSVGNAPLEKPKNGGPPNKKRFRFPAPTWAINKTIDKRDVQKITEILPGDDQYLRIDDTEVEDRTVYEPHRHGGPIHLINCCINQTIDDRTGNFNADRKGVSLTVSALGAELTTKKERNEEWTAALPGTTLAQWIAISGAAAGTGMGSNTKPGVAAMLFLSGFRLGYWWRYGKGRSFSRIRAAFGEMFAQFPGLTSGECYLSDGGHFDNTGVYALLRRSVPVILLADCGADPQYGFADVENLVRKARIDFGCEIDFIDPPSMDLTSVKSQESKVIEYIGTPTTIGDASYPNHYLLVARLSYPGNKKGVLIVVKPRRLPNSSLDVASYGEAHPEFPQQTTAEQFFDEARWESYERLGLQLGEFMNKEVIDDLVQATLDGKPIGVASVATVAPLKPADGSGRLSPVTTNSIGIGAIVTAIFAGYQAWDQNAKSTLAQNTAQAAEFEKRLSVAQETLDKEPQAWPKQQMAIVQLTNQVGSMKDASFLETWQASLSTYQGSWKTYCDSLENSAPPVNCTKTPTEQSCKAEASKPEQESAGKGGQKVPQKKAPGHNAEDVASSGTKPDGKDNARTGTKNAPGSNPSVVDRDSCLAKLTGLQNAVKREGFWDTPINRYWSSPYSFNVGGNATLLATVSSTLQQLVNTNKASEEKITVLPAAIRLCGTKDSRHFMLYIQIYDEQQRDLANVVQAKANQLGMSTAEIENVTATAAQTHTTPPLEWHNIALLYHGEEGNANEGEACAKELSQSLALSSPVVKSLGGAQPAQRYNLELWIPKGANLTRPVEDPHGQNKSK